MISLLTLASHTPRPAPGMHGLLLGQFRTHLLQHVRRQHLCWTFICLHADAGCSCSTLFVFRHYFRLFVSFPPPSVASSAHWSQCHRFLPALTLEPRPYRRDCLCACRFPDHPSLLEARTDQLFTGAFHTPTANLQAARTVG